MHNPALGISIVTYQVDQELFRKALESLYSAIQELNFKAIPVSIKIIDNGNQKEKIEETILPFKNNGSKLEIISGIKNIGYGRAHNLAILTSESKYHLILNPDVILERDSLANGLKFMEENEEVCAVAPLVRDQGGQLQYICKSYPSIMDLLLRGFAPKAIKNKFTERLNAYELREVVKLDRPAKVELISGCFMLCRTEALKKVGGFDEKYFLYFEDYALSMELNKLGALYYLPAMKIIHYGGNAARKGIKHIGMFISSGVKFFNSYGWKLS